MLEVLTIIAYIFQSNIPNIQKGLRAGDEVSAGSGVTKPVDNIPVDIDTAYASSKNLAGGLR